jgi:type II secretory pathway component GspD/PulD (secretin)
MYGIDSGGGAAMGSDSQGNEKRFTLNNPEREVTFRDCTIRLVRVEGSTTSSSGGGSTNNRSDRRAELNVRTAMRSETQQVNIEEYMSETVDNYEIICEEIKIGGGKANGRVRIRVRYTPPEQMGLTGGNMYGGGIQGGMMPGAVMGGGMMPGAMTGQLGTGMLQGGMMQANPDSTAAREEMGLEYNQFGNLNALIVRYTDPAAFAKLNQFILELDKPTPQVSIQTKFVTVNQEKAKEFSMNWNALDHDSPNSLTPVATAAQTAAAGTAAGATANAVNAAQNITKEYMDVIKNDYTIFSGGSPHSIMGKTLDWTLRLLEVEGVVTYVNGPQVTVMDGQSADFEIRAPDIDLESNGSQQYDSNTVNQILSGNLGSSSSSTDTTSGSTTTNNSSTNLAVNWQPMVMLSVEPEITSPESILMQIDVEIRDSQLVNIGNSLWSNNAAGFYSRGSVGFSARRKMIQTYARVKDGGTTVLGGWTGELTEDLESGTPGLRDLPWVGKLFFSRSVHTKIRTNLLVFLSANLMD